MAVPDVEPRGGIAFDATSILAILKYYTTHASAIAAVVSALVLILSGDQSAGVKALFEALVAIFAGTAALGLAAKGNDTTARLRKLESAPPAAAGPPRRPA